MVAGEAQSPLLCAHDTVNAAQEYCVQCTRNLCVQCSKVLHKKADFCEHTRIPLGEIKCSHDEEETAQVYCQSCGTHYCIECDDVIHLDPKIKDHTRAHIQGGQPAPPSPALSHSSGSVSSIPSTPVSPSPTLSRSSSSTSSLASSTTSVPPSPSEDFFCGKYKLDNRSTWGGCNEVRTGIDSTTHEEVALKVFTDVSQFENESDMLKKLRSEHVVRMIDVIYKGSDLVQKIPNAVGIIVLEKLQERLRDRLKRKLDFMAIRNVVGQIGSSLEFLHSEHRIIHGDLKPENVMRKDDVWKLIDLDSARKIGDVITTHTATYCPPEVAHAHVTNTAIHASASMDVWSFGVIFFELITGGVFEKFHGKNNEQILKLLAAKDFDIPFAQIPDVQARHLLQKMLVFNPQERATMPEVMRHAYFRGGLDTVQKVTNISNISNQLSSIKSDTTKILDQIAALRTQLLETSEYVVPRLFIIVPSLLGKMSWANPNHWGMNTFKLHLMCEHDTMHMTDHPGYPILDPKPFVRKAAPIVTALCKVLNAASSVAGPVSGGFQVPDAVIEKLSTLNIRPTEYLEFLSKMVDDVTGTKSSTTTNNNANFQQVRGQALRELKVFLDQNDPGNIYGRLEKVVLPDGHVRWMCPTHAQKYTTGVERLTKPHAAMTIPPVIPPTIPSGMKPGQMSEYKIVVLGSGGTHKNALTVQYAQGIFVEKYDPTIEDSYRVQREIDGTLAMLEILDTAGTEQFTAMRDLYMKNGHGFILCFNLVAQSTFNDLPDLHEQILRVKDVDHVPVVIAGIVLKSHHIERRVISPEQGEELARKFDAIYVEVIIREKVNVELAFTTLVRLMLSERQNSLLEKSSSKKPSAMKKLFGGGSSKSESFIVNKKMWQTAIHQAVIDQNFDQLSNLLVTDNSHVNAQDFNMRTALHYACQPAENGAIIKLLLEAGASLVVQDIAGNTPLHLFAEKTTDIKMWEVMCLHATNTLSDLNFIFAGNNRKKTPLDVLYQRKLSNFSAFVDVLATKLSILYDPIDVDLNNLTLSVLPTSVYSITAARKLNLRSNGLDTLLPDIEVLCNLTELNISNNRFGNEGIPTTLKKCGAITLLDAQTNKLTSIPDAFTDLYNLTRLDLSSNQITKIPDSISKLGKLQVLNVERNAIHEVSAQLARLPNLTDFHGSVNGIISFPHVPSLTILDLLGNALTSCPTLGTSLIDLNLSRNKIQAVSIPPKNKLENINLSDNQLSQVPDNLGSATKLKTLILSLNLIQSIPSSISHLGALQVLNLSNNQLSEICQEVFNLSTLTELNISGNKITELPENNKLSNLYRLDVSRNPLSTIPASISKCAQLHTLEMQNTKIGKLPRSMANMKIWDLKVEPSLVPLALRDKGANKLLEYLTQ